MKRCPIAAKTAGSIWILPRCVLNNFSVVWARHCTDFEADLWPETENIFGVLKYE